MPAPYDYTRGQQPLNLAGNLAQGLQTGAAIRGLMDQREALAQQKEADAQWKKQFQEAIKLQKPQELQQLIMTNPGRAKEIQPVMQMFKSMSRDAAKNLMTRARVAAANGRNDVAGQLLREHGEGLKERDPQNAQLFIELGETVKNNKDKAAQSLDLAGMLTLGDDYIKGIEGVAGVRETQAKTDKAIAETESMDLKRIRANLEAMAAKGGKIPVADRPKAENDLRKEYWGENKEYRSVRDAYNRVKATSANAAGDLALIFNYMKILDPGSTVREGEFATAQNATGVPDRVVNLYNNLIKGTRLGEVQRKQFKREAKKLFEPMKKTEAKSRAFLSSIAKRRGLNLNNIFREPEVEEETTIIETPEGTAVEERVEVKNPPPEGLEFLLDLRKNK